MTLRIHVQNVFHGKYKLPTRIQFKQWVEAALQWASIKNTNIELTIRLIDVDESAALNTTYRHKTGPTNILSFPMEEVSDKATECYLGDLAICVPMVYQETTQQEKKPITHWAHLTVHGVLHLLGYDHERKKEAEVMEALEIKILQQLGVENPYL